MKPDTKDSIFNAGMQARIDQYRINVLRRALLGERVAFEDEDLVQRAVNVFGLQEVVTGYTKSEDGKNFELSFDLEKVRVLLNVLGL